ncbi:tetratricopeptide repeat protein [Dyella jejuensis]|uniref:Tetratricopeptide repeat protein n=1 Tax=Dyella jejuensis TaxID=1432009 RepID=A0ABW8JD64_9GAMM
MDLPKRDKNHSLEAKAEAAFEKLIADSECFFVQSRDRKDYGVDFQIEAVRDGSPTNVRVHVQLKGTAKAINADGSISVDIAMANLNYLMMQAYSFYVCYHQPTGSLKFRSAEAVTRQYQHGEGDWAQQKTITVNFTDPLTLSVLERLAGLASATAFAQHDHRFSQLSAQSKDLPELLRATPSSVHVPDDKKEAFDVLRSLSDCGMDAHISAAFERFAGVFGPDDNAMLMCYLAEINLGMDGRSHNPGRVEDAIAYLVTHLDKGIYHPGSLHYCIGNGLAALNRHDEAVSAYQLAIPHLAQPDDKLHKARCLKNLGSSIENLGREDEATNCYREALSCDPGLAEAHLAIGRVHHRKGEYSEALKHFDEAIFLEQRPGAVSTVDGWRINVLFNLGDGKGAFRQINALLNSAETEKWIWPWCGRQVAMFGRTSLDNARQAVTFWNRFLRVHPDNSVGVRESLLATLYVRSNGGDIGMSYASFKEEFEAGIVYVDQDAQAHLWDRLGHWAQDEEDWAEAEVCYRHAYNLEGGDYGYCLGVALNQLGRFEESLPILMVQAKEIQPDALSWYHVATAHENLGQASSAISAYEQAIALDPDYAPAWFDLGGIHWNSGDQASGVNIWKKAAARFPEHELTSVLRRDFSILFDEPKSRDFE